MLQPSDIVRAMVVTAHPDDVDFGAAGTVATLTDAGVHVTYCLVTDGDAGGSDRTMPRAEMAALRRGEQTTAAEHVGVKDLMFLGHPDGRVQPTLGLRADIARAIRVVQPQVVIAQSPVRNLDRLYASHPDHLAAGEATLCAVYPDSRNPFAFPELLADGHEPWTVEEVWLMGGPHPSHAVDVTEQIDRKLAALMSHVSQHQDPVRIESLVRMSMARIAAENGLAEERYAEGFRVIDTR